MAFLEITKYKVKIAIRTKELYLYVIGFPLIFLLIYGGMASAAYANPSTIDIGILNVDSGVLIDFDGNVQNVTYGALFQSYLENLHYENTNIKIFKVHSLSDKTEGEKLISRLDIAAMLILDNLFSQRIQNFSKFMAYQTLVGIISSKMQEAYSSGNISLGNAYHNALNEVLPFANASANISLEFIGDPSYSKSMSSYEMIWKYFIRFVFASAENFTKEFTKHLESKYNITILSNNETRQGDYSSTINVRFERVGVKGGTKESFMQMYYSVLIPGQIMQSIMIAAIAAISMIGVELEKGLIQRIKLTKVSSAEYIGGNLATWGLVALFQSALLIAISTGLGYIKYGGNPLNYVISIAILCMAGIVTAAISIIVVSFVSARSASPIALILLITLSLFIAGYFPVPNPKLGEFMGRSFTLLDFVPWRAGITGLKKALVLSYMTEPMDVLPDFTLMAIWTVLYSVIAFATFEKFRLRKRE